MTRPAARALAAATTLALLATAPLALARNGADDAPGDDRGGDRTTDVDRSAVCSRGSETDLSLSREDGGVIEMEFEVDQDRTGQRWNVVVTRNGRTVVRTTGVTRGPSGSFEVRRLIPDRTGRDTFRARAVNPRTGEVCAIAAAI